MRASLESDFERNGFAVVERLVPDDMLPPLDLTVMSGSHGLGRRDDRQL
jgi:hypothetical protein